jgi:hypothetical protein
MALGLNNSMSVSIPFASIAALQLSLLEALLIARAATVAESLPNRGSKPKAFPMPLTVGAFRKKRQHVAMTPTA